MRIYGTFTPMKHLPPQYLVDSTTIVSMIPISITARALFAIASSFPMGWRAQGCVDGKDGYTLVLPLGLADLLSAIRQPGESFSDVILRVAADRQRLSSETALSASDAA
jgi:hypothetical protein